MIEFRMPSLGADMEDGTLVEWRKKIGDVIMRGDIIADVDTQKGLIEIEVFDEGILDQLLVNEGEKVPVGTIMALIKTSNEDVKEEDEAKTLLPEIEMGLKKQAGKPTAEKRFKITPLAKKIAQENQIDYTRLKGTGPKGEVVKKDVEMAISESVASSTSPREIPFKKTPSVPERKVAKAPSFKSIRGAVAAAMSKSKKEIPHFYLDKKVDMSKPLAWLSTINTDRPVQKRLLLAALLIKGVASSLDQVPEINGIWENELIIQSEINIGFVVSLRGGGIIVPVIKNVDLKALDEIMEWINDIIPRARAFNLRSSELSNANITITNLGERGADSVYGIIYPPQVAIIGFGNVSEEPFAENGMVGVRPVLHVTLSGDHRAIDGLVGSRFLAALEKNLQTPGLL